MFVPVRAHQTESTCYVYPEHLRPHIATLLRALGVYVFYGKGFSVPLYIGKSIDIRHRVMDHMRTPEEARQTRRITFTRTAGDVGARLHLEVHLRCGFQTADGPDADRLPPGCAGFRARPRRSNSSHTSRLNGQQNQAETG